MKNIAAKIKLDKETIIEYIIKGINDDGWDKNYRHEKYTRTQDKTKEVRKYETKYGQTNKRQTGEQKML